MSRHHKFYLERHQYAPELNKIRFEGLKTTIPCPGCTTTRAARAYAFSQHKPKRFASIGTRYHHPNYQWLNRTFTGVVESYSEIARWLHKLRAEMIPSPRKIEVKTWNS